jgi:hypothetical protein
MTMEYTDLIYMRSYPSCFIYVWTAKFTQNSLTIFDIFVMLPNIFLRKQAPSNQTIGSLLILA